HFAPHQQLEERLAAFVGAERALLFSTGYMANLGIVPALAGRGDVIFADKLNHASLIDAVRLALAFSHRYPHLDLAVLEGQLTANRAKQRLILTDAVFSMDGDIAPLPELLALAERYDAWLLVDDAHGFGVLGPQGRGTAAQFGLTPTKRLLVMGTLGKAAGVAGAFVAGDAEVIDWLEQKARTAIYTTAAPPLLTFALLESLKLIEAGDERREHLQALIARLRAGLQPICARHGWRLPPSTTAIQPLVIGGNPEALGVADALMARGIWAPAIRPPTVPAGQARLRISLSAAHSEAHVDRLVDALVEIAA
ncbi:MAG TPA: 8-amino-7-oxononanoate synthase, partial [Rhodocyclaceae bacterium]|nr:8-amino-7-oxononanoate synthase [Rhodocyclaceae bacterium]